METTLLSTGVRVPRIIKGGWQLAGGHGAIDRARAIRDMFAFAEAGVTTFDCADIYTGVESLIGDFLREWRTTYPSLADTIRVHTKCVPDLDDLRELTPADITRMVNRSRARLGVEAVDLVQLHWWDFDIPGWRAAAETLARLRDDGVLRDIGLTNFDTSRMNEIIAAGVPVSTHQVQYSLIDRRPANAMVAACAAHQVAMLCYGTLAGGFLSERWLGTPKPASPLENRSLTKYLLMIDEFGGWPLFQRLLHVLHEIGESVSAPIGAVAIRWILDRQSVGSVIVGARNVAHLGSTLRALEIRLAESQRSALDAVLDESEGPLGEVYELEREKGGRHAAIMRYNLNATTWEDASPAAP